VPADGPVIVDAHCHAGKGDGLTGPWDTNAPLGAYLRRAATAGITRSVLFAAFCSDYGPANEHVSRLVRSRPERLLGFMVVHPEADRGRVAQVVGDAVVRLGLRGIKAHRHDGRLTRELCEAARTWRLPLLYDAMGEVEQIELVASEYPDVAFVIPHLGSFADDWKAQRAFLDILARHPNVHTDTSGVRRFDLLVEAIRRAGADRVLFGSDGPWLHPGLELHKVRLLRLPPPDEKAVLGGNLLRLVRRVRTGLPAPPLRSSPAVPAPLPAARDPWAASDGAA
jgi:predicted TIM-barrel fold metal-dependent hydrolase